MNASDQSNILTRIKRIFVRPVQSNGSNPRPDNMVDDESGPMSDTRQTIVRPWNRNNQAIEQVQEGFKSLTELMGAIKQGLDKQSDRQDQLLEHLSALPKVLEIIPESNRLQSETLKAIHGQLLHQSQQQQTLGEILKHLADNGSAHKEILEGLHERVDAMGEQDKAMAANLQTVSAAIETTTRTAAASADVLVSLRNSLKSRDTELERIVRHQGEKTTKLLALGITISVLALFAAGICAWAILNH
jgi:chromosome segregation ATPase